VLFDKRSDLKEWFSHFQTQSFCFLTSSDYATIVISE